MTRLFAAVALVLAAALAPSAQTDTVHVFHIADGQVYLDGRLLPNALPEGLDLRGWSIGPMEFSGPIVPVLEIDSLAYVLENDRLVLLSESDRAGRNVYVMGEPQAVGMADMPQERMMPIVEAAYMRDVASRNAELFDQIQRERAMELDVERRVSRIVALEPGNQRRSLERELRGLLSDLLSLKHEIRAQEIEIAGERLDAARQALAEREAHHEEMVDGRLRELVGNR